MLAGCWCAACGSSDLRLTGSRVERRLELLGESMMCKVALARCCHCGHRERVLPFEALPGKVTGVDVVLDAVGRALIGGDALTSIAGGARVVSRTVKLWILGLGARVLDLERLYRHRASRAPDDAPQSALLHRWSAASVELARWFGTSMSAATTDLRRSASEERREAATRLVRFVAAAGGPRRFAERGAALFREAVLQFRGPRIDTPSSAALPCRHMRRATACSFDDGQSATRTWSARSSGAPGEHPRARA